MKKLLPILIGLSLSGFSTLSQGEEPDASLSASTPEQPGIA